MNEVISYTVNSVAWSLLGLIVGYIFGKEVRSIETIKEAVVDEPSEPNEASKPKKKTPSADIRKRVFGVILVVLSLLTILTAVQQQIRYSCQTRFNETSAEVQQLRGKWNDEDRQALIDFFKVYRQEPPPSDIQSREAFFNLISTYERNSELRKQTPIPKLDEECK